MKLTPHDFTQLVRARVCAGYHGVQNQTEGHRLRRIAIEGGKGTVELRADGVIHLIWTPNVRIDVADARAASSLLRSWK